MTERDKTGEQRSDIEHFAERHGIELATCRQAAVWAREWSYLLETALTEEETETDWGAEVIRQARDEAANNLGDH